MKAIALPFGDGSVEVQLPDRAQVIKASQPNARIAPAADETEAVRVALEQPLGMPRISTAMRSTARLSFHRGDERLQRTRRNWNCSESANRSNNSSGRSAE